MASMLDSVQIRPWLASALAATASWRRVKAEDYSDDPRNLHCAEALESAREYVLSGIPSMSLDTIAKLADSCSVEDVPIATPDEWPGQASQQAAARYFFDTAEAPTAADHERLLLQLYGAMVEDVREWGDGVISPERADAILGRLGIRPRPRTVEQLDEPERVDRHALWRTVGRNWQAMKAVAPDGFEAIAEVSLVNRPKPVVVARVETSRDPAFPWTLLYSPGHSEDGSPHPDDWILFVPPALIGGVEMKFRRKGALETGFRHTVIE